MDQAAVQKLIGPATVSNFARNTLVAIVPADSTLVPEGLPDLERAEVERIALATRPLRPRRPGTVRALAGDPGQDGVLSLTYSCT